MKTDRSLLMFPDLSGDISIKVGSFPGEVPFLLEYQIKISFMTLILEVEDTL